MGIMDYRFNVRLRKKETTLQLLHIVEENIWELCSIIYSFFTLTVLWITVDLLNDVSGIHGLLL